MKSEDSSRRAIMHERGRTVDPQESSPTANAPNERSRTPRFSLPSGSKPLEGYTIKRGIGVGGFGEVYFAISDGGKDVALKRIQRNLEIELRGVRQCLNLKHPNLLDLYDIRYDDEEQAWVVMEYMSGESLQDVVERNPNGIPLENVSMWFDAILSGVAHLHDCGIVHRDLKPGNIFVGDGAVKIGDYGLSKFISCSRRSGQTQSVGTFHYMAPEIGQGRYGKEIDIYALGIILYEMITGRVPYDGESSQEIIMKHLTAQPKLDGVKQPYRAVIARALAKDPEQRFRSIAEMRTALQRGLGNTVHSQPFAEPRAATVAVGGVMFAGSPGEGAPADPQGIPTVELPNEPIARAVHAAWTELAHGWRHSPLGTFARSLIICGVVIGLLINSRWIFPGLFVLGIAYLVYLGVRSAVLNKHEVKRRLRRTRPHPDPLAAAESANAFAAAARAKAQSARASAMAMRRQRKRHRRQKATQAQLRSVLAEKNSRTRATELSGSLLMAALVCAAMGLIFVLIPEQAREQGVMAVSPNYVWLVLSSTLGAWCVLGASKFWEQRSGDATLRRFVMLLLGAGTGAVSYFLAHLLMLKPEYIIDDVQLVATEEMPAALHNADGMPTFMGFVLFFGALFMVLRWWRQADPVRRTRLSVFSVGICALAAAILQALCPFPQGFMIAAVTAVAVQLAAPWMSPEERTEVRDRYEAAAAP